MPSATSVKPYLFNRKLRRTAYKRAAIDFKPAIKAAANTEMRRTWQEFEDRVAVRRALKANDITN